MKENETYIAVWKKYLPLITMKLKQVIRNNEPTFIGMYQFEFHTVGKKRKIGHQFDLEMNKGRVAKSTLGSIAAKDLSTVLKEDNAVMNLLASGQFTFTLNGEFMLTIKAKEAVITKEAVS